MKTNTLETLTKLYNLSKQIRVATKKGDYKTREKLENELKSGEHQLLKFYWYALKISKTDYLDVNYFPPCGVDDFIKALERFEVKEITVSAQNTGLMNLLNALVNNGWKLDGMINLDVTEVCFDEIRHTTKPAIKLTKLTN